MKNSNYKNLLMFDVEKIWVKCNQTGKRHEVPFSSLTTEDGSLPSHPAKGMELLMEYRKKSYLVEVEDEEANEREGTS